MPTPLLHLYRISDDGFCTLGRLLMPSGFTFCTVERPWKNNERGVSCVPVGEYAMRFTLSARFHKKLYILEAVPNRDGIRIHAANWAHELEGCIALGLTHGPRMVHSSRVAMTRFHQELQGAPARIKIHAISGGVA